MEETLDLVKEIMIKKITVHIYSTPNFSLEIFLGIIICLIYGVLHSQIARTPYKTVLLKPAVSGLFSTVNKSPNSSQDSVNTSLVVYNTIPKLKKSRICYEMNKPPEIDQKTPIHVANLGMDTRSRLETNEQIQKFLSLTPNQFVKIDKAKKRSKLRQSSRSLATLYNSTIERRLSSETIKRHIELAKEHLELAKMSKDIRSNVKMDVDRVTGSLFDLLERIITTSSLENPLPFRGDIAGLAVDMANLSLDAFPTEFGDGDYENMTTADKKSHQTQHGKKRQKKNE